MIEFSAGSSQPAINPSQNYFAPVTPVPAPGEYEKSVKRVLDGESAAAREHQRRQLLFDLFALSELALLVEASFGKPQEVRKARRQMAGRDRIRGLGRGLVSVARLPYNIASVPL